MDGNLRHAPVLVVDCQTTGANPQRGHLLEIGWTRTSAASWSRNRPAIESHLVALPPGAGIPRAITRLTGLRDADLGAAVARGSAWRLLRRAATGRGRPVAAVAHFARFEDQFLRHLHAECDPRRRFPLQWLCTHEIARRLFPDLPRRGLRALAGYFDLPVPELKRAADHVAAQAGLWARLVAQLERERGIRMLDELLPLLAGKPPARATRWRYPLARETRLGLPDQPGVYRFLSRSSEVLYVGKATSLRKRVNSYYRKRRCEEKLLELVTRAHDVQASCTRSALEAALLEVEQIHRFDPPYNRALRDQGQGVWFCSRDLTSWRESPDERHSLGPLPGRETLAAVRVLADLLRAPRRRLSDLPGTARQLMLDPRRLETQALRHGCDLLRERHRDLTAGRWDAPFLMQAGAVLLTARVTEQLEAARAVSSGATEAESVDPRLEEGPADEEAAAEIAPLEPAEVADGLEHLLVHAARLRSRARLLALLSESVLRWNPPPEAPDAPDAPEGQDAPRTLSIRGGAIAEVDALEGRGSDALREGFPSRLDRLAAFDRLTYNRLRVLMTEMRRLTSQGREVELLLSPGLRLHGDALRSLLARC